MIPPQTSCKRSLFNYKKADLSLLCDTLSHVPWNNIPGNMRESTGDDEESWQLFIYVHCQHVCTSCAMEKEEIEILVFLPGYSFNLAKTVTIPVC